MGYREHAKYNDNKGREIVIHNIHDGVRFEIINDDNVCTIDVPYSKFIHMIRATGLEEA